MITLVLANEEAFPLRGFFEAFSDPRADSLIYGIDRKIDPLILDSIHWQQESERKSYRLILALLAQATGGDLSGFDGLADSAACIR